MDQLPTERGGFVRVSDSANSGRCIPFCRGMGATSELFHRVGGRFRKQSGMTASPLPPGMWTSALVPAGRTGVGRPGFTVPSTDLRSAAVPRVRSQSTIEAPTRDDGRPGLAGPYQLPSRSRRGRHTVSAGGRDTAHCSHAAVLGRPSRVGRCAPRRSATGDIEEPHRIRVMIQAVEKASTAGVRQQVLRAIDRIVL